MDTYPHWGQLAPADRLRLAALEAELAKVRRPFLEAICEGADVLEQAETKGIETETEGGKLWRNLKRKVKRHNVRTNGPRTPRNST